MKDWKSLDRHPRSAEYEDLIGDRWDALVKSIADGFDPHYPIFLTHDGLIVDGWQRLRACIACDVKPTFTTLLKSENLEALVERMNDARRHESETQKERRLETRRARVAQARTEGKSFREIAEEQGIDPRTARRDAESHSKSLDKSIPGGAAAPPDTAKHRENGRVEPPKTTGLDGKTYSASKSSTKRDVSTPFDEPPLPLDTPTPPEPKAAKSGKVRFDEKPFEQAYGALVRWIDKRANAKGKGKHHKRCMEILGDFHDAYKQWLKETA